jgi:hypothetical protein
MYCADVAERFHCILRVIITRRLHLVASRIFEFIRGPRALLSSPSFCKECAGSPLKNLGAACLGS